MQETWVWSLGGEDPPGEGHGNLLQYPCLENPHGQRSLAGSRPQGFKESDRTEQLTWGMNSTFKEGQHTFKGGLSLVTYLNRTRRERETRKNSDLTEHLSHVIKVSIRSGESYCVYPWYDLMRIALYLCGPPPPNPVTPIYSWEKHQTDPNWKTF